MARRITDIVGRLKKRYGPLPAPPSDAFALFVWQILWNHSTAKKRDAAMAALKRLGALTVDGMWRASPKELLDAVAKAGPHAEHRLMGLKKGVEIFRREPDLPEALKGEIKVAMRRLKPLPRMSGDGPAYVMLLFAGDQPVLPVNARAARVATRLGYGERNDDFAKTAKSVRQAAALELGDAAAKYRDVFVYFDHHGATTCSETAPRCDECPLLKECVHGRSRL